MFVSHEYNEYEATYEGVCGTNAPWTGSFLSVDQPYIAVFTFVKDWSYSVEPPVYTPASLLRRNWTEVTKHRVVV